MNLSVDKGRVSRLVVQSGNSERASLILNGQKPLGEVGLEWCATK